MKISDKIGVVAMIVNVTAVIIAISVTIHNYHQYKQVRQLEEAQSVIDENDNSDISPAKNQDRKPFSYDNRMMAVDTDDEAVNRILKRYNKHLEVKEVEKAERRKEMKERKMREKRWEAQCKPHLEPISKYEYAEWLVRYVEAGGEITDVNDYPFSNDVFYRATDDFEIVPIYGAGAVNIVVPKDIEVTGNTGHHDLMKIGVANGYAEPVYNEYVPLFEDIKDIVIESK